jgi:hypothetical protein
MGLIVSRNKGCNIPSLNPAIGIEIVYAPLAISLLLNLTSKVYVQSLNTTKRAF